MGIEGSSYQGVWELKGYLESPSLGIESPLPGCVGIEGLPYQGVWELKLSRVEGCWCKVGAGVKCIVVQSMVGHHPFNGRWSSSL